MAPFSLQQCCVYRWCTHTHTHTSRHPYCLPDHIFTIKICCASPSPTPTGTTHDKLELDLGL